MRGAIGGAQGRVEWRLSGVRRCRVDIGAALDEELAGARRMALRKIVEHQVRTPALDSIEHATRHRLRLRIHVENTSSCTWP